MKHLNETLKKEVSMKNKVLVTLVAFVLLASMLVLGADSWAALTGPGSISYGCGLYASDDKWTDPATRLSWNVFQLSNGNYEYDYTFALRSDAKNISHVILQVSSNFTADDMLPGTTSGGLIDTWDHQGQSNLGMPDDLYGIKWNTGAVKSFSWSIVTDRAPMMGNFYAKDGNAQGGTYAYSGTCGSFGNNVVVPDSVVPIPGAVWLLGTGLIGIIGIRRKKKI
jgi:hypothetical protein